MPELRLGFYHGLGDCVQVAHILQLYRRRKFGIQLAYEDNKKWTWKFAGVLDNEFVEKAPRHSWGYPSGFDDLSKPDWEKNKAAYNLNRHPFPNIGDRRELWDELCKVRISAIPMIPEEAKVEADRFLKDLPKPLLCLHSVGTNWQQRKSLPNHLQESIINGFLHQTGGSVIILDWDNRAVCPINTRVKGILPEWGMIDQARLAALYEKSDLMIGVDSGPFHFASMTNIPALGVFRSLHHCRVCLPNPNAAYLVPSSHHRFWRQEDRIDRWRTIEYNGSEPTVEDILNAANGLLGRPGPYVPPPDDRSPLVGRYLYRRVGYDERHIKLEHGGRITEGGGGCEQTWDVVFRDRLNRLLIHGEKGVTCELICDDQGTWRGRWRHSEKMPIELIPVRQAQTVAAAWEEQLCNNLEDANMSGLLIRPEYASQDLDVLREVTYSDGYFTSLINKDRPYRVMVDIGAHIGAFAWLWHQSHPECKIICVEACPENIPILEINVCKFATVIQAACSYSDKELAMHNSVMPNGNATGGSIVVEKEAPIDRCEARHPYWYDERPIKKITLEQIMELAGTDYIDMLKLDCEGSEFDILTNTKSLDRIAFILGEYHGLERWDSFRAKQLPASDWDYGHMRSSGGLGIFHYKNKSFKGPKE